MLKNILNLSKNDNSIGEIKSFVRQGIPTAIFGVSDEFKSVVFSEIERQILLITRDILSARFFKKSIEEYSGKKVVLIPPKDEILLMRKAFSKDASFERIQALSEIKDADVIVMPIEAVMQPMSSSVTSCDIEKDAEYDRDELIEKFVEAGYKRVETVTAKSTFSVKGDMVEIFPINTENPYHLDFFGDYVENVKEFDVETRKSIGFVNKIKVLQACEIIFSEQDKKYLIEKMDKEILRADANSFVRLKQIYEDVKSAVETGDQDELTFAYHLSDKSVFIDELLKDDAIVLFDEGKRSYEVATLVEKDFTERYKNLLKSGEVFSFSKNALLGVEEIKDMLSRYLFFCTQTITSQVAFFNPLKIVNPKSGKVADYKLDFKEVFNDVKNWQRTGYKVIVATGSDTRADKLMEEFCNNGIACHKGNDLKNGNVCVSNEQFEKGFIFHEEKIVVIGSNNLYLKKGEKKKYTSKKQNFFSAPSVGDYCVHEVHGIGRVLGVKKISTTEGTKDYVSVEYKGGDVLYVPVEQMDILTRYLGGEKNPSLSKIGGRDFDRIKSRVKESIKQMSFDLKKLYEERNARVGFKFELDEEIQSAFTDAFKFEDTVDQATTISEITTDMTSSKVMDRLVCGDVGFGKTEMAFRAVFLCVMNGKQAVLLAPTTILTEQHYNTAIERFKGFGVKIACLNRFRTEEEQRKILNDLKNGDIDFIIGTHRLLSKDVKFKDLGLLVLDEEQRFGVEHKEKIKLLKNNVDTLTLTATPIPRTLHMSLSGIRSISTINTPPKKRLPVQTYVTEETDALIKDAILREINRGGQCFVLYNRVESIYNFEQRLKLLLPDVKFTVAHGQMEEKKLENGIMEFYSGQSDVLISTTIIENGIDLPKANTLIVIDANNLGLSTLYQLKGRVGRSDRLAYAYFTYKRDSVLTSTAYQRLNAIVEFAEMGSGIKIAMRDLEIRGAGNVLGKEQHGHMDKIGYELYSKLLKAEIDGEEELQTEMDVRVNAFIPETYIESNGARMSAYKDIAEIDGEEAEKEIREGLEFTFGSLPVAVDNLMNIAIVKVYAKTFKITNVTVSKDEVSLTFSSLDTFKDGALMRAVEKLSGNAVLSVKERPMIEFRLPKLNNEEKLYLIRNFLKYALKHKK